MNDLSTDKILEDDIENYLVEQVEALGGLCLKLRPPVGRGYPDRTCMIPDQPVFLVETKRPKGGRITVHQRAWKRKLLGVHISVYFASNRNEVDFILGKYK